MRRLVVLTRSFADDDMRLAAGRLPLARHVSLVPHMAVATLSDAQLWMRSLAACKG